MPSPMGAIVMEHFHGAVTRVGVTDTAVPHREPGWNLLIPSVWMDPATADANIAWTRETFAALQEHFVGRRWLNYLGDDRGTTPSVRPTGRTTTACRGEAPLRPGNVFHLNHNIAP